MKVLPTAVKVSNVSAELQELGVGSCVVLLGVRNGVVELLVQLKGGQKLEENRYPTGQITDTFWHSCSPPSVERLSWTPLSLKASGYRPSDVVVIGFEHPMGMHDG